MSAMSSKGGSKSSYSNYNFFKALIKSLRIKDFSSGNEKLPFIVTPTAVGGSEQQPALINELKTADDDRKLKIIVDLKESIQSNSISSILETWIPARQILYEICRGDPVRENPERLRAAIVDLLFTCIQYDDLSQLSVVARYLSDILFFCEVSSSSVDPQIKGFLNSFYLLTDNKLIDDFHSLVVYITKNSSDDITEISPEKNISLMYYRSVSHFIIQILSCDAFLQTNESLAILLKFIEKMGNLLKNDRSYIFDNRMLALSLDRLYKIALLLTDFDDTHMAIHHILLFIHIALHDAFLPISVMPKVLILLFYFYSQSSYPIIEDIFDSLLRNDSTCQLTFHLMCELIGQYDFEQYLHFKEYNLDNLDDVVFEDTQLVSLKGLSNEVKSQRSSKAESYIEFEHSAFPFTKKVKDRHGDKWDLIDFSSNVLSGLLHLNIYFIESRQSEILSYQHKAYIFDSSSYKFQALVNALYNRLHGLAGSQKVSLHDQLFVCKDILLFVNFLMRNKTIFKNIPGDLFFYELEYDGYTLSSSINLGMDQLSLGSDSSYGLKVEETNDLSTHSLFDVLDLIYEIAFKAKNDLRACFPHLFKNGKSYATNIKELVELYGEERISAVISMPEIYLYQILCFYHLIIDAFQEYSRDAEHGIKLEPADVSQFILKKSDILTVKNWKQLLKNYEDGSRFITQDNLIRSEVINSFVLPIFDNDANSRRMMFQLDDPSIFQDIKLLVLKTIKSMIDFHFDLKGNNERLWPLVICLFGNHNFDDQLKFIDGNSFFKTETDDQIVLFLLQCLKEVLITLRHKYFEELLLNYILSDIVNFANSYWEENDKTSEILFFMPVDTLRQIVMILTELFVKSAISEDIKHGLLKAKTLYFAIISIFKYLVILFRKKRNDETFLNDGDGTKLFFVFFVIFDCLSRLRATEVGNVYFDNSVREFQILVQEQPSFKSNSLEESKSRNNDRKEFVSTILQAAHNYLVFSQVPNDLFSKASLLVKIRTQKVLLDASGKEEEPLDDVEIDVNQYFNVVLHILDGVAGAPLVIFSWYSMILQLSNIPLFNNSYKEIKAFRLKAVNQMVAKSIVDHLLDKEEKVILQKTIVRLLSRVVIYSNRFTKEEQDQIVNSLVISLNNFEKVGVLCIHTLTVCCYQIPLSLKKFIQPVLWKLQQHVSNPDATPHVLEFLLSLSYLPSLMSNFSIDDFKSIFGMAFRFIQTSNDHTGKVVVNGCENVDLKKQKLANYLSSLSYSVISNWFLKMKMKTRSQLAPYIIKCLFDFCKQKDKDVDSRCVVLMDFIERFSFSNNDLKFQLEKNKLPLNADEVTVSRFLYGLCIISVLSNNSSLTIAVKRPSGPTKFEVKQRDVEDNLSLQEYANRYVVKNYNHDLFVPTFSFLQLVSQVFPETDSELLLIPDTPRFGSLIQMFDSMPVIEAYKAGLMYIGPGQESEQEILSNSVGSKHYHTFISRLGDLIRLKGCMDYYTAGLDYRNDTDGEFAYCWNDKMSQLMFHITTMMPTINEESWIMKKRHVGNDFVNIFFDESGKPFDFNIIKSQFTFVNIVITPVSLTTPHYAQPYDSEDIELQDLDDEASIDSDFSDNTDETFFQVKTYLKPGVPEVFSTCRTKTFSSRNLPVFVRNLALLANQYAKIWHSDTAHISNWTHRYNHLLSVREKAKRYYDDESKNGDTVEPQSPGLDQKLLFLTSNVPIDTSSEHEIKAKLFGDLLL